MCLALAGFFISFYLILMHYRNAIPLSEALVTLKGKPAKAMADQLTTIGKARLIDLAGLLSPSELQRVERARHLLAERRGLALRPR